MRNSQTNLQVLFLSTIQRHLLRTCRVTSLLAAWLLGSPVVQAQSIICTTLNGTQRTCEDGFTCAYAFTGGVPYERFTFRTIESGNPNAETSVIVEIGGKFQTVREGHAEQGAALGWTVRSSGEGESFYRVGNTNSSGDVVTLFICDQADTVLEEDADDGDNEIEVEDETLFSIGDPITIDPGGPNEEENVVVGFGSLVLESPLQFSHVAGTVVISQGPIATVSEPAAAFSTFDLSVQPNPIRDSAEMILKLNQPQHVLITLYDAIGRRVAVLQDRMFSLGTHRIRFAPPRLPSGVYTIRVASQTGVVNTPVTLIR